MKQAKLFLCALLLAFSTHAAGDKTLLAIFAHPDDESTISPILAKYVREGVNVHVVIATDGRYGTNEHSALEAGDELAEVRALEMQCAADRLGVELIHLDYHDQLRASEGYDGHIPHVRALIKDVTDLVGRLQPDVMITWGPDGGSNHMDHRLIGDTVSGVFLSRDWGKKISLYYYGTPASLIDDEEGRALYGVDDRYMTTSISYEMQDFQAAVESVRCHESQFTAEGIERMMANKKRLGPVIYLRKFEPPVGQSENLF